MDARSPVLAPGTSKSGIWVQFTCETGGGWATFVPANEIPPEKLQGGDFIVETTYKDVKHFARVDSHVPEQISALPQPGDYHIQGTIQAVYEDGVLAITAAGFTFLVEVPFAHLSHLAKGEKVAGDVLGLCLWDINA